MAVTVAARSAYSVAVIGTLGGALPRARLAMAFGSNRPAALIEDAVAVAAALAVVLSL